MNNKIIWDGGIPRVPRPCARLTNILWARWKNETNITAMRRSFQQKHYRKRTARPTNARAASYLEIDLVHDLVVSLQFIQLHFEVGRGKDVGEDKRVQVHGLLVAPQGQHVALFDGGGRFGASTGLLRRRLLLLRLLLVVSNGRFVSHLAVAHSRSHKKRSPHQCVPVADDVNHELAKRLVTTNHA